MMLWVLLSMASLALQALAQSAQTTSLLPLLYPPPTSDFWSNLTISFFPATSDTCAVNGYDSAEVLTFTTADVPTTYCFNLQDHFSSNLSIVDDSISHTGYYPDERFRWRLYNANAYSNQTNYSRIWYQQRGDNPPADGRAQVFFNLYNVYDCFQNESSGRLLDRIPIWTCESSEQGDCYQVPFSIMSFELIGKEYPSGPGKCSAGWKNAAANGLGSGTITVTVGTVAMLVAGLLSW